MHTVNVRVTHQRADVATLEAFAFSDVRRALKEISSLPSIKECVIIQTCNRVEIYAAAEDVSTAYHDIIDYVMEKTVSHMKKHLSSGVQPDQLVDHMINSSKKIHDVIEVEYHFAALHHLMRLTCGLESMIVGEDQILGQVRDAYHLAYGARTVGPFFKSIFSKAVHVGQRARKDTRINKGAVSVGSAAVELAENVLGDLGKKTVLLIGAGDMGTLVARSLTRVNGDMKIIVTNRTVERSQKIAGEIGAEIMDFRNLEEGLKRADLVITATSAPKSLINASTVRKLVEEGKKRLVIIDVSIPRNVDQGVVGLPGVELFNIDSLRGIAEKNRRHREMEAVKVEEIIEEELSLLEKRLYRIDVEDVVKVIFGYAEEVRQKELSRAMRMLGDGVRDRELRILDDLTRVIVNRTMSPIVGKLRKAAETGDKEIIKAAEKWFLELQEEA
jgi:glutamyl-tRNA reductase